MEEPGEDGFSTGGSGRMKGLAAQEIAAEGVCDCEGETIESIAGFELALEVGRPEIVGREDRAGGLSGMTNTPPAPGFGYHAVTLQDIADSSAARQMPSRVALVYDFEELLAAPGGMAAAGFEERLYDLGGGLIRRTLGSSGAFFETHGSEPKITVDPFIGGLTRDPVELAEFCDGKGLSQEVGNELCSLFHG